MKVYNIQSKILNKKKLSDILYQFTLEVPEEFEFIPGQFVSVMVAPSIRRSYSVLYQKDNTVELLVDVAPGGPGSKFFENAKVGDIAPILGPLGRFIYQNTPNPKTFIATGTGIAPFVPMIQDLIQREFEPEINLFLGTRYISTSNILNYLEKEQEYLNFHQYNCISQPETELSNSSFRDGRVTKIVPEVLDDIKDMEFYICGVNVMIDDMVEVLKGMGVKDRMIFFERYG